MHFWLRYGNVIIRLTSTNWYNECVLALNNHCLYTKLRGHRAIIFYWNAIEPDERNPLGREKGWSRGRAVAILKWYFVYGSKNIISFISWTIMVLFVFVRPAELYCCMIRSANIRFYHIGISSIQPYYIFDRA